MVGHVQFALWRPQNVLVAVRGPRAVLEPEFIVQARVAGEEDEVRLVLRAQLPLDDLERVHGVAVIPARGDSQWYDVFSSLRRESYWACQLCASTVSRPAISCTFSCLLAITVCCQGCLPTEFWGFSCLSGHDAFRISSAVDVSL